MVASAAYNRFVVVWIADYFFRFCNCTFYLYTFLVLCLMMLDAADKGVF